MKRIFILLAAVVLGLGFTQCSKTGPAGPQGPEGPQGPGAKGITFEAKPADWVRNAAQGIASYSYEMQIPELTNDIYQNGAVITYIGFASTDYYEAVPEVFNGIAYGAIHSSGFVTVDYHALDGTDPGLPTEDIFIKIVLIPAAAAKLHPNVDFNNFKEVQKTFLIK